jgi:hypothetical protein
MTKPYYLIDFENVQPALDRLTPGQCRVIVFTGETTRRVDVDLAFALPRFGADIQRIGISGSGPNALDFHIAFYIGHLAATEPGVAFTIVSKDTGFDPLVKHLKTLKIACRRIAEIPVPAAPKAAMPARPRPDPAPAPPTAKPKAVTVTVLPEPNGPNHAAAAPTGSLHAAKLVRYLKNATRPGSVEALKAFIRAHSQPARLDDAAVLDVIRNLEANRTVVIAGTKVSYALD